MFPSGHFILISKPSEQRHLRLISLSSVTFSSQLFRQALLRPDTSYSKAHEADLPVGGNPTSKQSPTLCHTPIFSCGLSFTHWRMWAHYPLSGGKIPSSGSSSTVLLIHPSGGPPRAFLLHLFWQFRHCGTSISPLRPPIVALSLCQVLCVPWEGLIFISNHFSPQFESLFFISSSTVVIHSPIRALFNPNVIQPPVTLLWRLKILFLHLLSLDLLLSHQKN